MLESRFQNSYLSELESPWTERFQVEIPLYKNLNEKGAWTTAKSITQEDRLAFEPLSKSGILADDRCLHDLTRRWNNLCLAVQECAIPQTGLRHYLLELAQVRLSPLPS
jgi:hypothetical protein